MDSLMNQGLELMLVGMGVVFVFLIILVGVTTLMSALVQHSFGTKIYEQSHVFLDIDFGSLL